MLLRITLLLSIIALAGCATNTAPRQSPEEWLNQQSQEQIDAVVASCTGTHANYVSGKSPVDCRTRFPYNIKMSFPTRSLYVEHEQGVGQYLTMWCVGVGNRTGRLPGVQLEIREEGRTFGVPCKKLLDRMDAFDK